jgi:hypothetical protein
MVTHSTFTPGDYACWNFQWPLCNRSDFEGVNSPSYSRRVVFILPRLAADSGNTLLWASTCVTLSKKMHALRPSTEPTCAARQKDSWARLVGGDFEEKKGGFVQRKG